MVSDYDLQAIAYWVVVPFALYAISMDRIPPKILRPIRTPEAPAGILGLLAIAMTIWPAAVESHRAIVIIAIVAVVFWLWCALHVREMRLEAKDGADVAHRKAPVLSNCDRLLSKIVRLTEDVNLREGNILFGGEDETDDPEAAKDKGALIDTIRREIKARYYDTIYDDLVGLRREMEPFKFGETELSSILKAVPFTGEDYDAIVNKFENLIRRFDAASEK